MNVVIGKIGHLKDLAHDPQAIANKFVEPVVFPSGNSVQMPTIPVGFSEYKTDERYDVKGAIGEDTRKVLSDIGYSDADIESMIERGAAK